ncbi:MAG: GNAT family N-acetyltransferase [Anaerolineae bacterium]
MIERDQIEIRPVTLDDLPALQANCFLQSTLAEVENYLLWCLQQIKKGRMVRLVATVNGEAVANAQLFISGRKAEIGSLVVNERFRKRGIARQLIETLTEIARQCGVRTLEIGARKSDQAVSAFYQRMGFVPFKETVAPYLPGDNKLVIYMRKELRAEEGQ